MAKMGRPIIDKPKAIVIKARINEETNNKLIEYCKKNNLSVTDVIRLGLKKILEEASE